MSGTAAWIAGTGAIPVWGLDARERLTRQLGALGVEHVVADPRALGDASRVLVVAAGYLFELRTLRGLLALPRGLLRCPVDGRVAAGVGTPQDLPAIRAALEGAPPTLPQLEPAELDGYDRQLRKSGPPLLEPLRADTVERLETLLYDGAYKGITDFVTKWWWPRPARRAVGWCVRLGVTPNQVTGGGLLLVIAAGWLFAAGWFALGLACAWIMTFLDTVDGKLARVTVTSSRLGHWLDHGIDIVHPPIWYLCWSAGLVTGDDIAGIGLDVLAVAVVAGYVGGRLVEAAFHRLGDCGLFAWRPFDAWFRLVTARRNPCLVLLTAGYLAGRADWGYLAVVAWTVASTLIMLARLVYAARVRRTLGPLDSWLREPAAAQRWPRAFRLFAAARSAPR